jgi:hypothetical protein
MSQRFRESSKRPVREVTVGRLLLGEQQAPLDHLRWSWASEAKVESVVLKCARVPTPPRRKQEAPFSLDTGYPAQ